MKLRGLIIFTSLVLLTAVLGSVLPVNGEVRLYDKMIRLHVLANSDSEEDQNLKLQVRDAVLQRASELLDGCATVSDAKRLLLEHRDELLSVCRERLSALGCDCPVSIELGVEKYPERTYDSVTLPAGDYYSVRVLIGEAEGHNWWCVLFPQLCVGASKDGRETLTAAGLTKDEVDILTENDNGRYVLKFRLIEFFRRAFADK